MAEIFHVLYRTKEGWKIQECEGEDGVSKWQVGNPGAKKVRFILQPQDGSGNFSYPTMAQAFDAAKPGDQIKAKVDAKDLNHEAVSVLCELNLTRGER